MQSCIPNALLHTFVWFASPHQRPRPLSRTGPVSVFSTRWLLAVCHLTLPEAREAPGERGVLAVPVEPRAEPEAREAPSGPRAVRAELPEVLAVRNLREQEAHNHPAELPCCHA